MPWKSDAQRRWGNSPAGHKALGDAGVHEWNESTKGKSIPEKVKSYKDGTDYVSETGSAIVHKGEAIVPAKENMAEEKKHNPSLYRSLHHLNKGGLHRALGIKEGENIPEAKLEAASHSTNDHIKHMALFAKTMSHFKH